MKRCYSPTLIILFGVLLIGACSQDRVTPATKAGQGQSSNPPTHSTERVKRESEKNEFAIVQAMLADKVIAFFQWKVDAQTTLYCLVRDLGKAEFPGETDTVLSIWEKTGKLVFKYEDSNIESLSASYVLRVNRAQLILQGNAGGRINNLQVLDYKNGSITTIADENYNVDAQVRPSFRDKINPAEEPYQLLLTNGTGLASPDEKETSVYRYTAGTYQFAGTFSQRQVDNYIEQLLKNKSSKRPGEK